MGNEPRRVGGKGSDVLLGGEHSGPNAIRAKSQPAVDPIDEIWSWESSEKRDLRKRLRVGQRVSASRAARTECDLARTIFWGACDYAGRYANIATTIERLTDARASVIRLLQAGDHVERLEGGL